MYVQYFPIFLLLPPWAHSLEATQGHKVSWLVALLKPAQKLSGLTLESAQCHIRDVKYGLLFQALDTKSKNRGNAAHKQANYYHAQTKLIGWLSVVCYYT